MGCHASKNVYVFTTFTQAIKSELASARQETSKAKLDASKSEASRAKAEASLSEVKKRLKQASDDVKKEAEKAVDALNRCDRLELAKEKAERALKRAERNVAGFEDANAANSLQDASDGFRKMLKCTVCDYKNWKDCLLLTCGHLFCRAFQR